MGKRVCCPSEASHAHGNDNKGKCNPSKCIKMMCGAKQRVLCRGAGNGKLLPFGNLSPLPEIGDKFVSRAEQIFNGTSCGHSYVVSVVYWQFKN